MKPLVSLDLETHLIQPGLAAPPIVCGSYAREGDLTTHAQVVLRDEIVRHFKALLAGQVVIGGANLVYDLGCFAAHDPRLLKPIFDALDADRFTSTDIIEALHDNARGLMFVEANGTPFGRYSLGQLEARYLSIDRSEEKHGENAWRLRYAELDGVPLEQWPQEAIDYPRRDAQGTYDVLTRQLYDEGRQNLQCVPDEMRAAWALRLASIWGMRTDGVMVAYVVREIHEQHERSRREFFDVGIVRVRACTKKKGEYEKADDISEQWLDQATVRLGQLYRESAPEWLSRRLTDIESAKKALRKGKPIRFATDTTRLREIVSDAYQGDAPRTEGGEVSYSRDTLEESGSELLEQYAEDGPNEKLLSTYVDVLEQGTRVPINPEYNSIVATQRTSCRKPNLQQLPRKGRVRECFVPRQGSPGEPGWVYCSVDYSALEMCTLAQCCVWLFQSSAMADQINAGRDLHVFLASQFLGIEYDEGAARRKAKEPAFVNLRQAAKPCFGADTLVLTEAGWKRIVDVELTDRLWDGVEWVTHSGLVDKGEQTTWAAHSVDATPDHEIWTGHGWRAWKEVLTSRSLFQSALSSATLPLSPGSVASQLGDQSASTPACGVAAALSSTSPDTSSKQGTPNGAKTATSGTFAVSAVSDSRGSFQMRSTEPDSSRDSLQQSTAATAKALQTTLTTAGEESRLLPSGAPTAAPFLRMFKPSPAGISLISRWIESTTTGGMSPATFDSAQQPKMSGTAEACQPCSSGSEISKKRMRVYDLSYAGPRNRYTILTDKGPVLAHNCNFGLGGLMGAPKLVFTARKDGVRFCELLRGCQCGTSKTVKYKGRAIGPTCVECLAIAEDLKAAYFSAYPEVSQYHEVTIATADECADGIPLESFGTGMRRLETGASAVSNHFFQNLAAQGAKRALYALSKEAYTDEASTLFNRARPVVFVHDEVICEIREDEKLHENAWRMAEVMRAVMQTVTPDVKISAEPALMRRWFKGAELVTTKDGRAKPWWPKDWAWGPDQAAKARDSAA